MAALLLLLFVQWVSIPDPHNPKAILTGTWQSCREADGQYSELIYDYFGTGQPRWELHLGPSDEFALFKGVQAGHRDHASKANLLGPAYHAGDVVTWRGKRNWAPPELLIKINVTQAGGARSNCESFFVQVERRD